MSLRLGSSACGMLLLATSIVFAQDRGSIAGAVTDNSGASVPQAIVTLTNPATGLSLTFTSGNDGGFSFQSLAPGQYALTVEKPGFRKFEITGVTVAVNTSTRADVKLEIGQLQETVQVRAEATQLQPDRSDLGKVIDKQIILDLPLFANGGMRSNLAFATLTPGVRTDLSQDPDTVGGAPVIAGGTSGSNTSLLVDGGESESERRNDPQMRVLSVEGVEEFKVMTSAFSAEYGRSSNGILNYVSKSGTNDFHGSLFAQIRNQKLDADGFFYVAPLPSAQTVHNQNLEAASVGGPVWIPKVFNGRNKLFFFFSGERSRAKDIVSSALASVPTAAARTGDFSGFTGTNGSPIVIYNPYDASGNVIANANARVPFPNNQIPQNMLNPVAVKVLSYEPLPQNPNSFLNNNPVINTGQRDPGENQGVYSYKLDFDPTAKMRFNGLFSRQYFNGCNICLGPIPGPEGEGFQENYDNKYTHFNADYIFRPTLLGHFSFNFNERNGEEAPNVRLGANTGAYGLATELPGVPTYLQSPLYTSFQTSSFGNFNTTKSDHLRGRTLDVQANMAWLHGRHSVKWGFEYLTQSYDGAFCNTCGGAISFSSAATANPSVSGVTGSDLASFLLGAGSGSFAFPSDANFIYPYYAAFIQDDIKVNSKLTLNVGLRYDLPLPKREQHDGNSQFDPAIPNPGAGNLLGALLYAGTGPGRSGLNSLLQHRTFAFGPRMGFAYQLTPKTVIRAGAGIFYNANKEDGAALDSIWGFGGTFNATANYFSSGISTLLPNGTNGTIAGMLPFAAGIAAATPPVINPSLVNFQSPSGYYSDGKAAQIYDFNFTVEQSLSPSNLIRASFHANYGNELQSTQQYNQLNPKYIPIYGNLLTQPLSSLVSASGAPTNSVLIANGYQLPYPAYPLTQTLANSLEPYPQYNSISGTTNGGHSTYNALETLFAHNFSHGLFAQVSYTFSKWLSDNTSTNVYVVNREKDLNAADRPNIFAFSYVYAIPYGHGQKFGSSSNAALDGVLGGWRVSGVQHYQDGSPISFASSCSQTLYGAGVARCTVAPGVPLLNPSWNPAAANSPYVNPKAFSQPANGVFGTMGVYIPGVRNRWQLDEDVALSKSFNLSSEKRRLEFRASAFNIANRHLLGSIGTAYGSSTFGEFTNPQANLPRNVEFSLRFTF